MKNVYSSLKRFALGIAISLVAIELNAQCATAPTSVTSSVAGCLKSGRSTTLTQVGGTLPSGGSFKWYEGGCGAGTSIGTGNSITVSPTTTSYYYVRAEDGCGNTVCANYTVIVADSSLPAITIISNDTGCLGVKMKFKRSGGTLGSSAQWSWYRNGCGGSGIPALGNGDSINVFCNLGLNTIYLRAEGQCNNTNCITKTIYIRDSSVRPNNDSLTGLFCLATPVTMYASTGTLGFGATAWKWYRGSCGGTLVGSGNTLIVTPTSPGVYTYYRRAEGACNTTVCAVHKFRVQDTSKPANSVSGPTAVCQRSTPLVFKPVGGNISSPGSWTWSRVACTGGSGQVGLGSGDSLVLTTAALGVGTHTIFVKGTNGCNATNCVSTTVTISDTSVPATSLSGTSTICLGQSSTLTFSGGMLGAGGSWKWYEGSCGGTAIATGTSYVASPASAGTYTYYLRAEGTCNNTICRSFTLTVRDSSIPASSVSASATTICLGQTINLSVSGGNLGHAASWKWYSGSCGGTYIGTGSTINWGPPAAGSVTVFGRAEGTCNNTICRSITITVRDTAIPATSISSIDSGCQGVTVKLKRVGGALSPGSTWNWYRNGCATTGIPWLGAGDSITIQLSNGWNYIYLTATGGLCNVPKCATKNVYIRDTSVRPNNDSMAGLFCLAKPVTMNASTGTLGFGATAWKWYSGSCGGTFVGSGNTLTITPSTPGVYTYYRRAEGYCNTTICAVHKFKVQDSSKTPTSISGPTSVCERSSSMVFKPVGGNMSSSGAWNWSRVACTGSPGQVGLGSGDSLVLTTAALGVGTHTIYVRGLNGCNTTNCVSKTITISDTSVPASSISGTSTICLGQSSTLTFSGGKLGAGASWKWYQGSCGGTAIATGTSYTASPTIAGTYTYYLRAEGTCNNTVCKSFTLTVRDTSVPASGVSGTKSTFCLSDTSLLTLSGGSLGTGASWKWYVGACSGISIGSGTSHIASPNQGGTFTYYVRAEGTCNNTVCKTITLTVRDSSVPTNSISGTSTICKGQSSTLTLNGGSLGTGGTWKWYLGSCSGTSVSTGSSFTASPASAGTYTYYVRAEGTCNTTACRSFTLTVNDTSTPATSATATSTTICKGQSTTLSKNGGSLGTGATWEWYSGSCTGTPVGSGSSLSVTPTTTTTYYVKAEGTCNNTSCKSVTITVRDTSVPAVSISGTTTICKGQSTTFTLNGGSLGTGGSWKWYSGSCGGTSAGTGTTLTVTPAAGSYTYYVRAEGTCNNTACKSVTLTVNDTSVPATSATATSTTICKGQSTTLSKNGGSLGTGATWEWYSGSCTGTPVGSGSSLSVTPASTTTYYVKAEGTCNNTSCQSVTITVRDTSVPATVVTGTASTICKGESVTLTLNGGSLGTGGSWKWYSGSCGGTSAGTGTSVTLSPQSTTTYYVRAEGTCNNTACKTYTVTVRDTSVPATSATAGSTSICRGQSTTLSPSGGSLGTGGSWKWYTSSCGGTSAGTGASLSVTPNTTTTYYVRAEGTCNNTVCKSVTVTVKDTNIAPTSISGPTSVCQRSAAMVFKPVGGTLSPGASWTWSRVACTGSSGQVGLGSGDSISYTTAALGVGTHTIYVIAVGGCNTSKCVSKTITISDTSVPATSISGTSTICVGQSSTLSVNGGKLGAGASWKWYSGSCGGTSVGTGSSLSVTPTTTTTYFARAEGTCNNTTCQSFTVTVRDSSVPATSISGTTTICRGQSSTFTLSGGSLGTGGSWKWYNGSCGGTSIATGTTLTVTPAAGTFTYYVRAEGTCNNTVCKTITLTVRDTSVPANSISGTSTICKGQSSTLTLNGGSLGTGGTWKWYLGSCSGTSVSTGSSFTASPASAGTYTYYVRAEGTCNTTACRSFTLTVNDTSTPATTISGTTTLCKGQGTTLTLSGGSLGTGGSWKWYTSSCGGTSAGTGASLSVTPNTTTTYYVRAEGTCNNTVCKSVTVTVKDTNIAPTSISGPTSVCQRSAAMVFKPVGGTLSPGASWTWSRVACTGSSGQVGLGSGDSISYTTAALGVGTHTIYVIAVGGCNTSKCVSKTITISDTSVPATSISGTSTICVGQSSTLSVNGGKLGAGASWKWYSGSCGGTSVGTGSSLSVTPTTTTTYFARAEGTCNNTTCQSFTVTVRDSSVPATSISGTTTICRGQSSTFTLSGGSLGTGGSWKWYNGSCGGTSIATGTTLTVTPAAGTFTYYVRAEGTCNNTVCKTITLTVRDTSVPANSISGTSTICKGQSSTLTLNGGSLGTGGTWKWYLGSCSGTSVSTGSSFTASPASAGTYTYYVRAEGTCNTTACRSFTLTVNDTSTPATSATATSTTICKGQSTTLSKNGGSLGTGATWEWYSGSCTGTPVGSGSSLSVTPTTTTTYYVKAEGTCNNTSCKSVTITVRDTSVPAVSISGTTTICKGQSTTFTLNGGSLGTGGSWKWYSGSCGGTSAGTGTTLTVTPAAGSYTYYVRAEGTCNNTACKSVTLTVNDTSVPATSATATSTTICKGQSTTLSKNGGSLGTGATWEWYSGSCTGTPVGSGSSLSVTPTTTTTYYVKAEGTCNNTSCQSVTITVRDTSVPATVVTGTASTICKGESVTLTLNGGSLGTGGSWKWYSGSCGGTSAGTGTSVTLSPQSTTTYYVRAEGTCNNTACKTYTVTVRDTSVPATSATAGSTSICRGQSTTLSPSGGSLGTGGSWKWYTSSCGGTSAGTGASLSVTPNTTTTYYVRAEGTCNNTVCKSVTVTVKDTNIAPTSISGPTSVCQRSAAMVFKPVGGTLSPGASWTWSRVACTGSSGQVGLGSGDSISYTTAALGVGTHTIYVIAVGGCNTSKCVSKTITISDTSVPATSISGTSTICVGQSSTLSVNGGKLGAGASWKWYSGSCGGTSVGTGSSLSVTPTTTTTYFARAEGTCNNTTCQSFTVTVRDSSVPATSISGTTTICRGQSSTFTLSGGSLGTGGSWKWYNGSCGGTSIATGTTLTVTPAAGTFTYYVRAEGTCNNTVCKTITLTVRDTSVPANSISGTSTICKGQSSTLTLNGGSLGTGGTWKWYLGSCSGTSVSTGSSFTASPASAGTYTYYVRAEGTCNTTACRSFTLTVNDTSTPATTISGTTTLCKGQGTTLTLSGGSLGTGGSWKWYTSSCGGTSAGTGASLSVTPNTTTTYYVRAEGTCNNTACKSVTVTVKDTNIAPTSISGPTSVCQRSAAMVFKPVGGTLSPGASWTWSRVACTGSSGQVGLGSGDSISYTTAALGVGTHTIYVIAVGGCNTSKCVSKTITISDTSVPATSISGTSTICVGQSSTLSVNGGKLGAGASWKWYSGSCGGTSVGTGSSLSVTPTTTTTYFARAEGTCNNTTCQSFTVTVRDSSVPATSISGTTTICRGQSSTFTLSGGSLGTGGSWKWYNGSCGGTSIATGTTLTVTPAAGTFTYYVRAEGTCNNTVCKTITLTVRDTSVPANSISGTSTICKGQSSTLTLNGGSLGTGGTWKWYLGSCSGTSVSTGSSFTASPASAGTYTYYVRAEGTCNTTACRSFTLTVNDTSTPATSATATSTTICKGQSTTLSKNGGSLGTGATWEWYSGSCTGTPVGSGSSLSVTPTTTTTYYVKAEGTCNNTSCKSVTITVRDTSVPAVSISGTTTICKGQSTTFTLNGGSLGTGGSWKWYSGSCGGTSAGTGTTLTVTPAAGSYTYYVRAEGTCNNTACKSVTLTVNDTSVPATSATATSTTICKGQSTTLSKNGGSLGTGATWEWYSGSCTGTPVGSGSSLSVTPTTTTTYYVKAEGTCNNTSCQSVTITVRDTSVPATVVTGTASTICKGESVTLTLNGGSLGTGGSWKWYSGSCGGTSAGTGTSVTLSPQSTTTYYVRAEGTCNNTACKTYTVTVRDTSVPATSATAGSTSICRGQSTTLSPSGGSLGTGGSWKWYTSSCGGTSAGTGASLSVTPNTTTTYYVRAEGTCNNTVCKSVTVTVKDTNIAPTSISGPTSVCQRSAAMVFKPVGGTLSPGASWTWSRVACTGSSGQVGLGSGDSISYTTAALGVGTHTIYVIAVGGCNTSKCVSKTITISDTSVPATSISGTSTICVGQSSTLSVNGGKLGAGASWKWYSGSCGGTSVGTGSSLSVTPTTTTTYFARAEGTCNNTTCQSFTVTVRDSSVPATSISGTTTICRGQSSTFTLSGGSLGTGGSWKWYNGSCGGTSIATGTTLTVTPAAGTFTYYVRAEGTCNNTVCKTITLTVRDTSVPANSISGTSTICKGQSSTLTLNGGSLGTGGTWKWYLGSCSGTSVSTGSSFTASPASAGTYTYYVRAEGTCNTTACRSFTLTVNDTSTPATTISGTTTLCKGQGTTLTLSGGSLGTGASWKWYNGSCGGTSINTGTSLSVTPNTTTTYYVRAEGTCNNTACKSVTVTVRDTSEPAFAINAADTTCDGKFVTFTVIGGKKGHGASWNWYRTACGGSGVPWMGSGDTLKVKLGVGNHDVYLRAQGTCNTTKCVNSTVTVVDTSVKPSNVTANPICLGSTATLNVSGGKLGYNAKWRWYSTCGGTSLGTGSSLSVTPTAVGTYSYYVRAEGQCNNTGCATVTLTVKDTSKPATSISGPSAVCQRSAAIVLKPVGGNLSQGASWTWTRVACHGSSGQVGLGSGDSLSLTTASLGTGTHTIYLKAIGGCNSTACISKTITVNDSGIAPSAVSASPSTICVGESATLSVSGGQTGSNGSWKWYTTSCGVASAGTGSSITVSPGTVGTNTYYVRAEATCGNTICKTVVLTVRDTSQPVVSISGTITICQGSSTTLSTNGGSLASGAAWKWYSGSCGGTSVGTGSSVSVSPASTTTYFVRAEGTCKNSPCKSVVVTVRDTSRPATSITGTSTVCKGSSTTLSVNGGTLGFGASWKWYSGSCAGTSIGTGSSISVSPASNTSYFVRAENTCNTTICRSINVTVQDTSIPALFISGNTTICRGQSNTFTLVGGTLGTGASWKWYNSSCGVGSVGTGSTLTVSPTIAGTYTYYVRAEGNCGNSACINVSLTVRDTSVPASSISGTTTICKGQSTTLSVVGGSLGHGAAWKWYQGSCLGSFSGTGSSLVLTNLAPGSYTYFVRAEGTCNTTICRSISLTVRDTSTPATSIIGSSTICRGQSSVLTLTGGSLGTGAAWKWYEGSCGGTSAGTGVSITVTPAPGTYTYYARAEGVCNNTICQTFQLTVRDTSVPATSVNGTLSTLCVGQSTTLSLNGGSLGTGGSWKWYLGSCGFTTVANTGSTFVLNPTVAGTYTYFVRAEGTCNTTICRSFTITVRDTSVAPSAITGTSTLCQGQKTTLAMTGGYLGTGATWKWYLGSCGGTAIATGVTSLTVSPASAGTYTYFVRAEGTCNNSVCRSFIITMRDTSGKPISISGPDTVCEGVAINLSRNGGITGTGATWNWYRNACGGSGVPWVGNGNNISVKMGSGEHYFYLKADGVCNTTACVTKKVVVVDSSIRPGNSNEFFTTCLGNKRTLTVNGGRLGYRASWKWYATCGGTVLATGPSLTVTPTATGSYTYYVRSEGPCNVTPCAAITFTVIDSSKPATAISGPLSVCPNNTPFTLKRVGGSLSPGGSWVWSRVACHGSPGQVGMGSGDSITLTPLALGVGTHVFYIKGIGGCNQTACTPFTMTVRQAPAAPSAITGSTNICKGQSTTLSVNGGVQGTDATWTWYSGTCGGTPAGTGASITVSPTDTTTYFVRSEGPCGITGCASVRVDVIQIPVSPVAITANYNLACAGTPVKLYANGPALLNGETRHWYINNGGTLAAIGTGDSITVTLSNTSDIELRTENRCFNSASVTKQITIQNSPVGTWMGIKNSSWHESDNWCGGIPTASTDVVIPSGTPNQPVITANAAARNLTINAGADLNVASTGNLSLNGSFTKSGTFTSSGVVAFRSGGAVTADGFITRDLEINLPGEVTLNGNVTVNGRLVLGNGSVITGSYEVNVTNDDANAVISTGGNNNFRSGWIAGNLRRSIKAVDSTYHFPVGSIAEGNNAEFNNHNVAGVSSVLAHFRPKPGNDVGLNVFETATANPYGSVSNGGVWYLEPNGGITSGNFDLKLWFHNQATFTTGLVDNSFSILNRPASSTLATDWVKPATNSTYIAGTVSSGYVQRNGINIMGQFGMGITLYPVSVKNATINSQIKVMPNPFNASFNVKLELNVVNNITVKVFDQAGRLVIQRNAGKMSGSETLNIDASSLPEGVYTVVIEGTEGKLMTSKMLKIKQ